MSGDDTALVIAIVGVFGTLAATIISQYFASKSKRTELAYQDEIRKDDRKRDDDKAMLEVKRSCYVQFMATARNYRMEMLNLLRNSEENPDRQNLEEARRAFVVSFAEAQLIAGPDVLDRIEPFNLGLTAAYNDYVYKHREPEMVISNPFKMVDQMLKGIWDNQWPAVRESMRKDLST